MRAAFSPQADLSFGFDASRIGGLPRMLGFVAVPDGRGAWMPLMATGGTQKPSQRKHINFCCHPVLVITKWAHTFLKI